MRCSPIRVLVIEGEEPGYLQIRGMLATIEDQSYDVQWVGSWDAGIEAVRRRAHDVCLLDLKPGNGTGRELLTQSRDSGCKAPVILLSSPGGHQLDEMIAFGAADVLVRDKFTPELLERSIRYSIVHAQTLDELQRLRDEVRASELRFRSVVQSAAEAIILADDNGRIVGWNKGAEEIFGYSEEEILGSLHEMLMPASYRDAHRTDLERFRVTGRSKVIGKTRELQGLRKNGSIFPIEFSLASWRSGAGTMFTAVVRDIAERKQIEELRRAKEVAEEANRAKSDFVANMSHELRTPLHAIIGFTNLMLQNEAGNLTDRDRDFLQRILLNAKDQLKIINGVLDLSKVEAGRMELQFNEISIETLLADVVKQLEGERPNHLVDLILRLPEASTPVRTDAARLKQVVINLVDNALKFTVQGAVTVQMEVRSSDLRPHRIDVTDTGVGIPPECIDEIFEPFRQLEESQGQLRGSGLGLSICRSLCHLMGYRLEVKSCPGVGSTFSVILQADAHCLPLSA
jgi:two-component system, sensor histidine kinase and response regulator